MSSPLLKNVDRNRMLAQRELQWASEIQAASNTVHLLDSDVKYRMLTNILSNYLWITILVWSDDQDAHKAVIEKALAAEDNLSIWGDSPSTLATISNWLSRGKKWNASDLSQLMRLFVVVVEYLDENINNSKLADYNQVQPKNLKMMLLNSENYQFVGTDLHRFTSNYQLVTLEQTIPDDSDSNEGTTRWKALVDKIKKVTNYAPADYPTLKLFKKRASDSSAGIAPDGPRSRKSVYTIRDRVLGLKNDDIDSKRRIARLLSYSSSGTNLHSIQPDSLVGGLEWIYGLPGGADTSGTTAEVFGVCWALSDYLPQAELDDLAGGVPWYLAPALAIVKNTHHTYFEFAIAIYVGEMLRQNKVINYVPGKYHSILDISQISQFRVEEVNDLTSSLLERSYKELYDARVDQDRYLFAPDVSAWGNSDVNQISLRGGTISNQYSYRLTTQAQIESLPVGKLIDIGSKVLRQPISNTDNTTAINLQLEKIYQLILTNMS
jgi:hypothetical protein